MTVRLDGVSHAAEAAVFCTPEQEVGTINHWRIRSLFAQLGSRVTRARPDPFDGDFMRIAYSLLGLFLLLVPGLSAQGASAIKAPALKWGPAPPVFPTGATMAVVSGDPSKAGPFTIELKLPSGYRIAPHFHPTDEAVEVKQGTFLVGMGDTFDVKKTKVMKVGDKGSIGATMPHYATAIGATIVEVTAVGPFALTYVNPADDPQNRAGKPPLARGER
jgi:hypothetical protein